MKSGLKPLKHDHRDYDYLKTKKLGAAAIAPDFPTEYNADAKLWTPDQETGSTRFSPAIPPMPYGCTNYTQCDLCADEDKTLYNPSYLESITHANANYGADLRTALQAVVDNGVKDQQGTIVKGQHQAYFKITPSGAIDAFDAVRIAMYSASDENRSVSVGTPWFSEFNNQMILSPLNYSLSRASWHNWKVCGWTVKNDTLYLIGKPWLGQSYADSGFCYISREVFNALMNIPGAAAFTIDKLMPGEQAQVVNSNIVQVVVSFIRRLFGL